MIVAPGIRESENVGAARSRAADANARGGIVVNPGASLLRILRAVAAAIDAMGGGARADGIGISLRAERKNGVSRNIARGEFLRPVTETEASIFVAEKDVRRAAGLVVAQIERSAGEGI